MALIAVLWGVALLSIVAASFLSSSSVTYRIARNSTEVARVEALAEAAVAHAVLCLLDSRPDRRWRTDGVAQSIEFAGIPMRISIQDELGRIDLNYADGPLLVRMFRSSGLDNQAASKLVDKILDWRESSVLRRLNGATVEDYRAVGSAYLPRKGSFQSVDELKLVMDMTPELYRRVEPALTVYSGSQFFDQRVAPPEALMALPSMDPARVATIMAARAGETSRFVPGGLATGERAPLTSLAGRAFTIRTEIERQGTVLVREAVVRLTDDQAKPYWILGWKVR